MLPVREHVIACLQQSLFLEDALAQGLINTSALARSIRPDIERRRLMPVTEAAVVMALKRLAATLKKKRVHYLHSLSLKDITVETNLTEYVFAHSPTMVGFHAALAALMLDKDECMNYSQGLHEVAVLVSASLEHQVEKLAKKERIIDKMTNICAVTLRLPKSSVLVPGLYHLILKALAWENINVLEVISVYCELTLLFAEKDIERAFFVLKRLARAG